MKRWRILSTLSLLALLGVSTFQPAAAASDIAEVTFTVPAGETITIEVSAFCLEFGQPFPENVSLSAGKAPINARRVMKAAALTGTVSSDVLQTQLAIWRAIEGEWSIDEDDSDFDLATALFEVSSQQNTAPLDAQGLPLNAVILNGSVEAEVVEWEAQDAEQLDEDDEPYYGLASIEITNTSDDDLDFYVPLGLVLEAGDEDEQNMGIAAVDGLASTTDEDDSEAVMDEEEADAEDEDTSDEEADSTSDEVVEDETTDDPGELPVTGLPGVPDTLLAMILGAMVLTAGLVLRWA